MEFFINMRNSMQINYHFLHAIIKIYQMWLSLHGKILKET